jgi:hypothetical protein
VATRTDDEDTQTLKGLDRHFAAAGEAICICKEKQVSAQG